MAGTGRGGVIGDGSHRIRVRLRRWLCGLHGHTYVLHYRVQRLSLLCTSCWTESPGWDLTWAPPPTPCRPARLIAFHQGRRIA
jgi:hypothetical protein